MTCKKSVNSLSINKDARAMITRAREEGIDTVWDRLAAQQPHCGYCAMGVSCTNCMMGPCRIDPFGDGPQKGVCGADADTIVARNMGRTIAAGSSAHSDHGRDVLTAFAALAEGETSGYEIRDEEKLRALAAEQGIATQDRETTAIARDLAAALLEDFGMRKERIGFTGRLPEARVKRWAEPGIMPRGIDRENVEMLHRTHMGVDNDYTNILLHGLRTSLSDGWGGSMVATELSDVMFGTPQPNVSRINLGTLKTDCVNIALHGHNPLLSDVIVRAAADPELVQLAKDKGASGINLVGLCCTGTELQMRKGIPMAGNHTMQELVILTGALDGMVIDYQCIMPSVVDVAKCYHTRVISTADKARFPGATHISFDPHQGLEIGKRIVQESIEAYTNRNPGRQSIPDEPVEMMAGFSVEAIQNVLGGSLAPLADAISAGKIRGAVAIVGCSNPKIQQDYGHVMLTRRLIENDILVLVTGCAAIANGKAKQMMPAAADMAGPGLKALCQSLDIPPVLHMGSCVDNTRVLTLVAALANHMGLDVDQLPLAGAAPEWYSEKAAAIGTYVMATGMYTVLGVQPAIFGSPNVVNLLTSGLDDVVGAKFAVEPDPEKAAVLIRKRIETKRKALGLAFTNPDEITRQQTATTVGA